MATETIIVRENSRPTLKRIWTDFRNQADPTAARDITGWAIHLAVKRATTDPDSKVLFNLAATLPTPTAGKYEFALTTEHTGIPPGTWPAEIRVWTDGVTTNHPHDAISIDYVVEKAIDEAP